MKIGVEAILTNVTHSFAELDNSEQKCKPNQNTDYNDVNCRMNRNIEATIEQCKCIPWFYTAKESQKDLDICSMNKMKCFDGTMANLSINFRASECPKACIYADYDLIAEEFDAEKRHAIYAR